MGNLLKDLANVISTIYRQKIQKILLQKEIFIEENDKITEEIINAKGVLGKFLASIH